MPLSPLNIAVYVGLVGVLIALFVATAQNKWQPRVFALLALRLAIGWHFCFEGLHKINSTMLGETDTNRPFSSANYFNVGDGPGAEIARKQFIRDPETDYTKRLAKKKELTAAEFAALPADQQADLCPDVVNEELKKSADATLPRATEEQQKTDEALKAAEAKVAAELTEKQLPNAVVFGVAPVKAVDAGPVAAARSKALAAAYRVFRLSESGRAMRAEYASWVYGVTTRDAKFKAITGDTPATPEEWRDYIAVLEKDYTERNERTKYDLGTGNGLEVKRTAAVKADLNAAKADLAKATDDFLVELKKDAGIEDPPAAEKPIQLLDTLAKYGITAIGVGLLLGLFTRLWCVAGIGFLVMTYFAAPPWPWLPPPPPSEGNPLFINKNLIEAVALLVVLCHPTGRWLGLDALIDFAWYKLMGKKPPATPQG